MDYLERLKNEQTELQKNIKKLENLLFTEEFTEEYNKLSKANRFLLSEQHKAMCRYDEILLVRLELND
jgi:CHASE3 domain sensor protein